jgi:hypothetical protein
MFTGQTVECGFCNRSAATQAIGIPGIGPSSAQYWWRCRGCRTHVCDRCYPYIKTGRGTARFLWLKWQTRRPVCLKCGGSSFSQPYTSND